jgi:hypothetical protein
MCHKGERVQNVPPRTPTPTHILRNVQHMCFVFETLANSIKYPARGGGHKEQRERGPKFESKEQNPEWVTKGH